MVICFIGDSLTLGFGDETALGWTGRITAALNTNGNITSYNLGMRKDATPMMQHRWSQEAMLRRMPDTPLKLVFCFGVADVFNNVAAQETLAAGVAMLTQAKEMGEILVVGPLPVKNQEKSNELAALSEQIAALCENLDILFIPVLKAMAESTAYGQAMTHGDGVHPTAAGYKALADNILQSNIARNFFGLE